MFYHDQIKQMKRTRRKIVLAVLVLVYLYFLQLIPLLLFFYFILEPLARERLFPLIFLGLMVGYLMGDLIKRKRRQIRILKNAYILRRFEAGERFPVGSKEYRKFKESLNSMTGNKKQNPE